MRYRLKHDPDIPVRRACLVPSLRTAGLALRAKQPPYGSRRAGDRRNGTVAGTAGWAVDDGGGATSLCRDERGWASMMGATVRRSGAMMAVARKARHRR